MVYVYRKASSTSARELSEALGGRRFRGRLHPIQDKVKAGDVVICWGETLPAIAGVKVLNGAKLQNKLADAAALRAAGVPTIETAQQKPPAQAQVPAGAKLAWEEAVEAAEDFIEIPYAHENPVFIQGIRDFSVLMVKLKDQLALPAAPQVAWLPRLFHHVGGADLLQPPAAADFWVRKEALLEEVRVHSFKGKSIRAGIKSPRDGAVQHPWIRSYDGGWSIKYDGFESTKTQRELAHAAVKALGLDFGAVDLAKRADGSWIVLEVNRASGLEGGSVTAYAEAIKAWAAR